jgi:hypothetical protein
MKIINHDATNLLFEKAEELGQEPHESWKCIHFKLSERPERSNHALYTNFIVSPIVSLLNSNSGYVYLCDDGDIIILFQVALKPVISKLGTHFGEIDPEHIKDSDDNMLEVFDLSKEWKKFHQLCESKYYRRIILAEEKRSRFAPAHITTRSFTSSPR